MLVNNQLVQNIAAQRAQANRIGDKRQPNEAARTENQLPEKSSAKSSGQRQAFVYDEKTLAVLNQSRQQGYTSYDQPKGRNQQAANAYSSVDNMAKREEVQAMLGVDLFA